MGISGLPSETEKVPGRPVLTFCLVCDRRVTLVVTGDSSGDTCRCARKVGKGFSFRFGVVGTSPASECPPRGTEALLMRRDRPPGPRTVDWTLGESRVQDGGLVSDSNRRVVDTTVVRQMTESLEEDGTARTE